MGLDLDYEEGSISDKDYGEMQDDEDIYLDRFPDPFKQPVSPMPMMPSF